MASKIWSWIGILILSAVIVLVALRFTRADDITILFPVKKPEKTNHFYSNLNHSATMEAVNAVVVIETRGTLPSGEFSPKYKAIGFSIGNGYIVALSHATNLSEMFPMAIFTEAKYFVGVDELQLVGRFEDITLFRSELSRPSIPFGDSNQLKYGTYIVIIGFSRTQMINVKDGIVSIPVIKNEFDEFTQSEGIIENTIMITAPMNPGDSGSPVIAFRDGRPEVVGIAALMIVRHQGMNFMLKSNYVKTAIGAILWYSRF